VRCSIIEPEIEGTEYERSPIVRNVIANCWGGTVPATHASIIRNEVIGRSDGSPGQIFYLEHTPLLRRVEGEKVEVHVPGQDEPEAWEEVLDFSTSTASDKHFVCDSHTGEVRFGPALRQPDGSVRAYGALPPRGAEIRFSAYRHGGGVVANVQANTLNILKTSIPYVDRTTNHVDATGGVDPETIEMAQMRAPELLRTRGRAVTPDDYESLARMADSRVQRARCVQPLAETTKGGPAAGQIFLMLVPRVRRPEGFIPVDQLKIKPELSDTVSKYLDDFRLLTVRLDIREPQYMWVSVDVSVSVTPDTDPERAEAEVERMLYRYLNPIVGGPTEDGWPFGRDLYPSDIYRCLQSIRGIEFIESMDLYLGAPGGEGKQVDGHVTVPEHGLIASAEHSVKIS
jgi:predicted phage baseplate assembly protein